MLSFLFLTHKFTDKQYYNFWCMLFRIGLIYPLADMYDLYRYQYIGIGKLDNGIGHIDIGICIG
jgi:hypothetical protein